MKLRDIAAAAAIAMMAALIFALPQARVLQGLSKDVLFWARHKVAGPIHAPQDSPTVVLAIDEETYRREPFAQTPLPLWTPQLAAVVSAALEAGAKVVAFDIVLPTSIEGLVRGYERDFLRTLRRGANEGRLVLGQVQHQEKPISPFPGYSFAVGHAKNIRTLNLIEDDDGIIRQLPLMFRTVAQDGTLAMENSLAVELAVRAKGLPPGTLPERRDDGSYVVAGYRVPPTGSENLLINFNTGPGDIPAYSLADIYACVVAGKTDYLERHFKNRVVMLGTMLDVEDRKLTSKRLVTSPEGTNLPERCVQPLMKGLYTEGRARDSIPGVLVHAAAVNNLLQGDALAPLPAGQNFAISLVLAGLIAAAAMSFPMSIAGACLAGLAVAWFALSTLAFRHGVVLPLFQGAASVALAFPLLVGFRFAVTDRDRRQLGRAFSLYLPKAEIDRMVASGTAPQLGGEAREVSILFSDIAGFSAASEKRTPEQLVADLNEYFSHMTGIVEDHGGFVEKFIGDAVVAVFGAPVPNARHAEQAVRAAMEMRRVLEEEAGRFKLGENTPIHARVGVNTGTVLIGNIGSPRRFNYTVMGDAVNLASRLEGVNKKYDTQVLVSEETTRACGNTIVFREIDTVRVVGRESPVKLYEPLAFTGSLKPDVAAAMPFFAEALVDWRAGRFAEAATKFGALAAADKVAARFAARARTTTVAPKGWDGVTDLTEK